MNRLAEIDSSNSLDVAAARSENRLMPTFETGPLHLRRTDPARNMARFYVLSIQPTLFGGASLMRNWGRIGRNGQAKVETFDKPEEADGAFTRLERAKRRRGYADPHGAGADLPR
jgi:predicted DNA-binding WGR domain protein